MKELKNEYDVVILAAGDFPTDITAMHILRTAKHLIACDGAVEDLLKMDIEPEVIVGDGDSVSESTKKKYQHISIPLKNKRTTTLLKRQSMHYNISTLQIVLHSAILVQQASEKIILWATLHCLYIIISTLTLCQQW